MNLRIVTTCASVACCLAFGHAAGCGSSNPTTVDDVAPDGSVDASRARSEAGASDSEEPPRPSSVPEGWKLYTDYDPGCGIYVPSDKTYLPKPLAWEPCATQIGDAGAPGPQGMVCRRMVTDWKPDENGQHINGNVPAAVGPGGQLRLRIRRLIDDQILDLVGDADGVVHQALLNTGRCLSTNPSLSSTTVMHRILDDYASKGRAGGAIGGALDDLAPKVYFPPGYEPNPSISTAYVVGPRLFVEDLRPPTVYAFETGAPRATLEKESGDEDLLYTSFHIHEDDVFFEGDSSLRVLVKVWTQAAGLKTLIGFGHDYTRAVNSFGTDGVDMVWLEASGRPNTSQKIYPVKETWTAKYTTDPAILSATKRRVRAARDYGNKYAVGCGYAAVETHPASTWGSGGFRLIRLSDGVAWDVVDTSPQQQIAWRVRWPLAVTCDEVFAVGVKVSHFEVLRIRIDSLGPGLPPD